jgi:anti-anti-sigma regulatory factor
LPEFSAVRERSFAWRSLACVVPLHRARRKTAIMLRISITPTAETTQIILEGRVAGPWADELQRTWVELAPTVGKRKVAIDLRNTTYADAQGIRVLQAIYQGALQTGAELITGSPWTKYLAEEVTRGSANQSNEEQ